MAKKSAGAVSSVLEKALADELKEVTRKHTEDDKDSEGHTLKGRFVYSTTERMKVIDRCLKFEGLKLKVDDAGFGSNFGKGDDEK